MHTNQLSRVIYCCWRPLAVLAPPGAAAGGRPSWRPADLAAAAGLEPDSSPESKGIEWTRHFAAAAGPLEQQCC